MPLQIVNNCSPFFKGSPFLGVKLRVTGQATEVAVNHHNRPAHIRHAVKAILILVSSPW
jgi:hypothetical protein